MSRGKPSLKQYHNLGELVAEFGRMCDYITKLKYDVVRQTGVDFHSTDVRLVALDGIQQGLLPCGWWMNAAMTLERQIQERFPDAWEEKFLAGIGAGKGAYEGDPRRFEKIGNVMMDYLRLSVAVTLAFRIENMFAQLLKELGETSPMQFGRVLDALLTKLQLAGRMDIEAPLRALAAVRNSLHNNGIHRAVDCGWTVDGEAFEFRKGQRVTCASWSHLVLLFDASVRSIQTILSTPPVSDLKRLIPDEFAAYPKGSENGSPES